MSEGRTVGHMIPEFADTTRPKACADCRKTFRARTSAKYCMDCRVDHIGRKEGSEV